MLTIGHYKDAVAVKEYFKEHLERGDYYSEYGQIEGKWVGKGAESLGIDDLNRVKREDFESLVDGLHPKTRQKLGIRTKRDRIVSYDMVFSAPKSVSIMALTLEDERLRAAHDRAVSIAFEQMEKKAMTRVRRGLTRMSRESRVTGNLIAGQFTHTSSRELDPQLHTHNLVFNLTYDPVEKRTKALDAYQIFMGTKFVTEVYRNALAKEVRSLGYEIEEGRHTWRIRGVTPEIEARFSKRAKQIEERARVLEVESGIRVDTRGRALLSLKSRSAKNHEIGDAELLRFQKGQLNSKELETLEELKVRARIRAKGLLRDMGELEISLNKTRAPHEPSQGGVESPTQARSGATGANVSVTDTVAREAIQYALDHVFERKSVVNRDELLKEALKRSAGRTTFDALEKELESPRFLKRGQNVMTREERKREVDLLEFVRSGKRQFREIGSPASLSERLTDEQKVAARQILRSRDQVTFLSGKAGVGKTFALTEITANSSAPVIVTAPTSGATDKLRADGFKSALTAQKLLLSSFERDRARGALIVVDEAGLLSTRQMESLFQLAKEKEARLLLVGDTAQHNSVEGGDALRLLESYSVITRAEIATITRQKSVQYREAIQALSQGKIDKGFSELEALGAIHEVSHDGRPKVVAREYAEKVSQGIKTIIVTPTWKEHDKITQAVREELKAKNLIEKEERIFPVYKSINFTRTEKRYAPNFQKDLFVSFHSDQGEFKQGEIFRVVGSRENSIKLEDENGKKREIIPKEYSRAFDVVEREEKAFSVGDQILMKANYASSPENRIPNGAIRKIEAIEIDGTIRLEGGNTLDPKFRHFVHGYAITSQASQGKDAEHVIISANSQSQMALSKNQFYVSASRGKTSISLYTDNRDRFKEAVERSSARELVVERLVQRGILRDKVRELKLNYEKCVEASRDLIERAFSKFQRDREMDQRLPERERRMHMDREMDQRLLERERRMYKDRDMEMEL